MAQTIPAGMAEQAEQPASSKSWVWLLRIEVEAVSSTVTQPVYMQLTTYREPHVWPLGTLPVATWSPYPFEVGDLEYSGEGDLPQLDITLANVSRWAMRYLHAHAGLVGRAVELYLLTETGLLLAWPSTESLAWRFRIVGSQANADSITLRCEMANFWTRKAPQDRYVASRCRWPFGSNECGYLVNAASGFTTCNKTLGDCVERGDDEVLRGLVRLHPLRFGGVPGVPESRA